jgi:hypothetical protein
MFDSNHVRIDFIYQTGGSTWHIYIALFVCLISHHAALLFPRNKLVTSNQANEEAVYATSDWREKKLLERGLSHVCVCVDAVSTRGMWRVDAAGLVRSVMRSPGTKPCME